MVSVGEPTRRHLQLVPRFQVQPLMDTLTASYLEWIPEAPCLSLFDGLRIIDPSSHQTFALQAWEQAVAQWSSSFPFYRANNRSYVGKSGIQVVDRSSLRANRVLGRLSSGCIHGNHSGNQSTRSSRFTQRARLRVRTITHGAFLIVLSTLCRSKLITLVRYTSRVLARLVTLANKVSALSFPTPCGTSLHCFSCYTTDSISSDLPNIDTGHVKWVAQALWRALFGSLDIISFWFERCDHELHDWFMFTLLVSDVLREDPRESVLFWPGKRSICLKSDALEVREE